MNDLIGIELPYSGNSLIQVEFWPGDYIIVGVTHDDHRPVVTSHNVNTHSFIFTDESDGISIAALTMGWDH